MIKWHRVVVKRVQRSEGGSSLDYEMRSFLKKIKPGIMVQAFTLSILVERPSRSQ